MNTEKRPIKWYVGPRGNPLFDERGFTVEIVDESGGEFVEVRGQGEECGGAVRIDPMEWEQLRMAIDYAMEECRPKVKEDIEE